MTTSRIRLLLSGTLLIKKKPQSWGYIPHIVETTSNIDTKKSVTRENVRNDSEK
jgi:hypothetical protein